MNKSTYQNILAFLSTASKLSATPDFVSQICPHLTLMEVKAILAKVGRTGRSYYLAMPPLLIDGVVGVVVIDPAGESNGAHFPARINFVFGQKVGVKSANYAKRALSFARCHWGDTLVADEAKSYVSIFLQDPTKLDAHLCPTTTTLVHFTTNRDWNEILNDHSAPTSELINRSIMHVTTLRAVGMELENEHRHFRNDCCCAHCGAGLCLTRCSACNHSYKDDEFRCGWTTPLPEKIVDYLLQNGHQFAINPAVARQLEAAKWSQVQSVRIREEQDKRIADLRQDLETAIGKAHDAADQERKAKQTIYQTSELLERLSYDELENAEFRRNGMVRARRNSNRVITNLRKEAKAAKTANSAKSEENSQKKKK